MSTLYLMCGLPFSGKSTVAKAIVEHIGCDYISLDDINHQRGLGFGGDGIPGDEWERTHQIAIHLLSKSLRTSDAILDDTCCFRWIRDRFRNCADSAGASTCVIYIGVERETVAVRMKENEVTNVRHGIKDEIFESTAKNFEPPDEDENVIFFNESNDIRDWLDLHFGI